MDSKHDTITLYTSQADAVIGAILRDGVCFSREEYVRRKYGESSPVFLTAYRWFASQAEKILPRPAGAELPYWAFASMQSVDLSGGGRVLTLCVPKGQAVFFDMYDWNRILQLKYMGRDAEDELAFREELAAMGLRESDVVLSRFYPQQKQQILDSWQRLFRHHRDILAGKTEGAGAVQAALWQIKREWVVSGI